MLPNSSLESMFLFFMIVVETAKVHQGKLNCPIFGKSYKQCKCMVTSRDFPLFQWIVWVGNLVGNGILEFESRVVASSLAMNGVNCVDPFFLAFNWANHKRIKHGRISGLQA